MVLLLTLLIGVVAGLRAFTPLAVVSWAAASGLLPLGGTFLAFLGFRWTPWVLSLIAVGELISDKLPKTPSRKVPVQFATRVLVGGVCGAPLSGDLLLGGVLGGVGAVIGTLGGAAARARLARGFGSDRPTAIIEDLVAIAGAILIVSAR